MNVRGTMPLANLPLLLAISVWTAINNALTYMDHNKDQYPQIKIPATNEEILKCDVSSPFSLREYFMKLDFWNKLATLQQNQTLSLLQHYLKSKEVPRKR